MEITKNVVYVLMGDTWTNGYCSTTIEGIHNTPEGANKHLERLIPEEKRRFLDNEQRLSDDELDNHLNFHNIKFGISHYTDGTLGFYLMDDRMNRHTYLKILERELED
jgi:hypothetical protein